jgi:hypothetical protein
MRKRRGGGVGAGGNNRRRRRWRRRMRRRRNRPADNNSGQKYLMFLWDQKKTFFPSIYNFMAGSGSGSGFGSDLRKNGAFWRSMSFLMMVIKLKDLQTFSELARLGKGLQDTGQ